MGGREGATGDGGGGREKRARVGQRPGTTTSPGRNGVTHVWSLIHLPDPGLRDRDQRLRLTQRRLRRRRDPKRRRGLEEGLGGRSRRCSRHRRSSRVLHPGVQSRVQAVVVKALVSKQLRRTGDGKGAAGHPNVPPAMQRRHGGASVCGGRWLAAPHVASIGDLRVELAERARGSQRRDHGSPRWVQVARRGRCALPLAGAALGRGQICHAHANRVVVHRGDQVGDDVRVWPGAET